MREHAQRVDVGPLEVVDDENLRTRRRLEPARDLVGGCERITTRGIRIEETEPGQRPERRERSTLGTSGPRDRDPRAFEPAGELLDERRLADAGRTNDRDDTAAPLTESRDHAMEHRELVVAAEESRHSLHGRRPGLELWRLVEDAAFERREVRTDVEPGGVGEGGPRPFDDAQRLGLAPGAIERERRRGRHSLAQWEGCEVRFEELRRERGLARERGAVVLLPRGPRRAIRAIDRRASTTTRSSASSGSGSAHSPIASRSVDRSSGHDPPIDEVLEAQGINRRSVDDEAVAG